MNIMFTNTQIYSVGNIIRRSRNDFYRCISRNKVCVVRLADSTTTTMYVRKNSIRTGREN